MEKTNDSVKSFNTQLIPCSSRFFALKLSARKGKSLRQIIHAIMKTMRYCYDVEKVGWEGFLRFN